MWNIYIFLKYFTKKKTLSGVFQSFIMKMVSSLIYLANCLIKVKFHIRLHNFIEKVRHWRFMLFVCDLISIFCRFSQFWEFRIRIRNCFVSCRLRKQIEITKGGLSYFHVQTLTTLGKKISSHFHSLVYFHVQTLTTLDKRLLSYFHPHLHCILYFHLKTQYWPDMRFFFLLSAGTISLSSF